MKMIRLMFRSSWLPLFALLTISTMIACGPPPPPDPPTNIRTDTNLNIDGEIVLMWDLKREFEDRVKEFRVYRDKDRNGPYSDLVFTLDQTKFESKDDSAGVFKYKFIDTNVVVGNQYEVPFFYKITSVDKENKEGPRSEILEAKTKNVNEPVVVENIVVTSSNLDDGPKIVVTWQANKESDILGYYVFRSEKDEPIKATDPNDAVSKLVEHTPGKPISWLDTKITEGSPYWYTVVAIDKGNEVGRRRPDLRIRGMVLAKVKLLAPGDNSEVTKPTFKWQPVDNAAGYVVIVQKSSRGSIIWRSDYLKGTSTEVTYNGSETLINGNTYYWYVFAYVENPKDAKTEDGNSSSDVWKFVVK